jgi:diguanylate cyclase (GGDEF)-like protein/PAS domain S-box-containing protein
MSPCALAVGLLVGVPGEMGGDVPERSAGIGDEGRGFTDEDLSRALMDLMPDMVFVVDDVMRVVLMNPAAERFLGRSEEQARGTRVSELFGPLGVRFEERLSAARGCDGSLEFEDWVKFGDREMWQRTSLVPMTHRSHGFVLGVARNITDSKLLEIELREHAREVERLAARDPLTDIANRRAFVDALEQNLARARRGTLSCVLFMDLDDFKRVNDERGHLFGDETLVAVAALLQATAREVDLVARIGGDEFGAVVVDSAEDEAAGIADRMRASVEALGDEIGIPLGLSIGIVCVDAESTVDSVMSTADRRMYERKGIRRTAG